MQYAHKSSILSTTDQMGAAFMEKVIYYFSGTGNSLQAARIIAAEMGGAMLVSMGSDPEKNAAATAEMIGFVCPVYEWDVPRTVKDFVRRLAVNPLQTPEAYVKLDNFITRKLGLPDRRTRYHNPYVTAADLMRDREEIP